MKPEPCVCGKPSTGATLMLDGWRWRGWCGAMACTGANQASSGVPGPMEVVTLPCPPHAKTTSIASVCGKMWSWSAEEIAASKARRIARPDVEVDPSVLVAKAPSGISPALRAQLDAIRGTLRPILLDSDSHIPARELYNIATGGNPPCPWDRLSDDAKASWERIAQARVSPVNEMASVGQDGAVVKWRGRPMPPDDSTFNAWPSSSPSPRPDGFDQRQIDAAKAVLLSTTKRGAK